MQDCPPRAQGVGAKDRQRQQAICWPEWRRPWWCPGDGNGGCFGKGAQFLPSRARKAYRGEPGARRRARAAPGRAAASKAHQLQSAGGNKEIAISIICACAQVFGNFYCPQAVETSPRNRDFERARHALSDDIRKSYAQTKGAPNQHSPHWDMGVMGHWELGAGSPFSEHDRSRRANM